MKTLKILLAIVIVVSIAASCSREDKNKQGSNLVMMEPVLPTTPYRYQNGNAPSDVTGSLNLDDDMATLGRVLFYDKALSINNSIACASCHLQHLGFADGKATSGGVSISKTSRNSMAISNLGRQFAYFWDERETDLEVMSVKPIQNHVEMGFDNLDKVINNLNEIPYYKPLFAKAFNNAQTIDKEQLATALQQFLLSIQSYQSKYDIGRTIDFVNYTNEEKLGMELFTEKLHCASCHNEPTFAGNWGSGANIGLELEYKDNGIGAWLRNNPNNPSGPIFNPDFVASMDGAFKIPSLRNIEFTAPYMHDGRFKTLEEVVEHYNSGVKQHQNLDWRIQFIFDPKTNQSKSGMKLNLTPTEKRALVAFMRTLSDYEMLSDPKFSNPFKPVN
ncbi:MAG: cytochrome-c peroxidase [Bacteroidia bacterium]|jgi:cytochrome c peroxidase|nr:cytochrome-c peroxidase [Bacteroidia bacterium]